LKDLTPVKTGKYELLKLNCGKDFVPIDELKAEAVKWIKEIKYAGFGDVSNLEEAKAKSNPNVVDGIKGFIKHFFNITEEDLEAKSK